MNRMSELISRNILEVKQYKLDSWSYFSSTWWKFHLLKVLIMHYILYVNTYTQCGSYMNLLSDFFGKKIRESNVITKKLLDSWFHEIKISNQWKNFSAAWKNENLFVSEVISWNQLKWFTIRIHSCIFWCKNG